MSKVHSTFNLNKIKTTGLHYHQLSMRWCTDMSISLSNKLLKKNRHTINLMTLKAFWMELMKFRLTILIPKLFNQRRTKSQRRMACQWFYKISNQSFSQTRSFKIWHFKISSIFTTQMERVFSEIWTHYLNLSINCKKSITINHIFCARFFSQFTRDHQARI